MSYSKMKCQMIQLTLQKNPFKDVDRNEYSKNYRQIYNDLLQLQETFNNLSSHGKLVPIPLNGKTWEEEKVEFWDRQINAFDELIRSGKVKSCEIKSLCEYYVRWTQDKKSTEGFWNHVGWRAYESSELTFDNGIQLDELIDMTKKLLSGSASQQERLKVNETLDLMGDSACSPRAFLNELEDKSEYHTNNLGYTINLNKSKTISII